MLGETINRFLRPSAPPPLHEQAVGAAGHQPAYLKHELAGLSRSSNGLRQFFENLKDQNHLRILDLGGVSQANVNYITGRGHKIYTEDLLLAVDRAGANKEPGSNGHQNGNGHGQRPAVSSGYRPGVAGGLSAFPPASNPGQNGASHVAANGSASMASLIRETLDHPPAHFDGVLAWDALEFLDEEALWAAVGAIQSILKPGGCCLTFFHTQAKGQAVELYRYQIHDHHTLQLSRRFCRPLPRAFNNRSLERLFGNFHSVKFFLAKDSLREVIITR